MRYIRAHSGPCCTIAISADGRAIASGGDDRSVKTWELATSQPIEHFANAHDDKVLCVDFNRSSNLLASASADKTVKVWNLQAKKLEFEPLAHLAPVYGVTFSVDDHRIYSCDDSGDVCIWDALDGRKIGTLDGHSGWVRSLAVSADGSMLATAGEDCLIRIWELKTPGIPTLTRTLKGHTDRTLSIGFSLDCRIC